MSSDRRFLTESGRDIFTGNELLLKGALEVAGGVHLLSGYPGSPVSGFFDAWKLVAPLLKEKGVVARLASNEALAMAMANGSQMAECRAIIAMKNVGLHVASDALALGVLAGTKGDGGTLVVCGDDPWSDSTQVPSDSRYLAQHVRLPMLEPSTPQEIKDWVDVAFKLGQAGQIYVGYMMTVALADGGGSVELKPNHFPVVNANQKIALSYEKDIAKTLDQFVLLPPRTWQRELTIPQRHAAVVTEAARLGINRIDHCPQRDEVVPIGFVAAGSAYAYLVHALEEMGLSGKFPILKLGLTYPLETQIVADLAARCDRLIVIEERRAFVETQIRSALGPMQQRGELTVEIWGKQFPDGLTGIPAYRGLHPSMLIERLAPLLRATPLRNPDLVHNRLQGELDRIEKTDQIEVSVPARTPTFCPGCPHRDSSSVLLELRDDLLDPDYMQRNNKSAPIDLVAHGDTGCYTMLMFEPNKPLMQNYSGMGLGGATGSGVDSFITNKQIVFMGDGTFFHSGQVALAQSISTGQDITYIILENKTTAMTGHQPHSGVETDLTGNRQTAIEIEQMVRGMVPRSAKNQVRIVRMNPAERDDYRQALEKTILAPGVKVVIADKECGITVQRRQKSEDRAEVRQEGFLRQQQFMNVATEVCENCRECTTQTGCPGLKVVESDYGPKIQTDSSWCVNDQACARIHACPSFEEVTVIRTAAPRRGDEHVNLYNIPDAPRPLHADKDTWRCYLAGVGGMGIGTATAILVTAGHAMGYHVQFLDKKGLAIRNGGVFSQIVFTRNAQRPTTPTIPYGKADLLLGVDLLEATRSIDPAQPFRVAGPDQTTAVINTAKTPTMLNLMGREEFKLDELEAALRGAVHHDCYFSFNVGDLCERLLDSKLYANIMMLGMAYQLGYLPLTLEKIEDAVRQIVRHEVDRNLRAFHIGRKIVEKPEDFTVYQAHEYESSRQALRRKANALQVSAGWPSRKRGDRVASQFRELMQQTFRATRGMRVEDALIRDVIIRAHDCVVWGGIKYARRYCKRLVEVFKKDSPDRGYQLTRAVVWNLAKVMLIKDEVYVSAMLTSPEKYQRDRRRFNVNPSRGDRIIYKHHNRPEFVLFGQSIKFNWKSSDWQLRIMSRSGWLRKVLPGWHTRERQFRDWYIRLVDRAAWESDAEYQQWAYALSTPETVTGYRQVRYPKQESARALSEAILSGAVSLDELTGDHSDARTVSLTNRIIYPESETRSPGK
jgi:indolepyruvate ferredoxin oxidoreductase